MRYVCVSLSLKLTPTHTERERADDFVWSRLDSPLLPPLPERGLSAGDQDDSPSWKRFPEDTYSTGTYTYTTFRRVCMCCVSLAYQIHMLIKQPTLAVEERREEGLHSGLTITGLTITHELWQRHQIRTEHTKGCCSNS